ncbi:hypothetical protein C8R43DRAFT_1137120 [Mycena crocata]|nr:hypothetical protein C8R43DRAFT_1137120 [Mycena crocata]
MEANDDEITINNAPAELEKAQNELAKYIKKSQLARSKLPHGFKKAIEARITKCQTLIAQSPLGGSPNDQHHNDGHQDQAQDSSSDDRGHKRTEVPIDPNLAGPPSKKKRPNGEVPRHRKIIQEDPVDQIADSIPARMTAPFVKEWTAHKTAITSADPSGEADSTFAELVNAAVTIMDHVVATAGRLNLSPSHFKWKNTYDGGEVQFGHITALHKWLVDSGSVMETPDVVKVTPVVEKAAKSTPTVRIYHNGKMVTLTSTMTINARRVADMYPGCVESGMDPVLAVLRNRAGEDKCITCHSGPRGKALDRPPPPPSDHPYLEACKCPVSGAALELWMIKMTAHQDGILKRGNDDVSNGKLALTPENLKLIGGAIEVASGHTIDTLLQPEEYRLEHTVKWALDRLHSIATADGSKYAVSFPLLSKTFKETMRAILMESDQGDVDEEDVV